MGAGIYRPASSIECRLFEAIFDVYLWKAGFDRADLVSLETFIFDRRNAEASSFFGEEYTNW